ncbi:MAG: alpha/beta hydrolase [Oryzihumus sp.]
MAALAVLAVAACAAPTSGGAVAPASLASTSATTAGSGPATPSPSSSATSSVHPANAVVARCGLPNAAATPIRIGGPAGNTLTGAVVGTGATAAVFVHETGRQGLCGFWPYAAWLGGQGVRSVLLDLCGHGDSRCDLGSEFAGDIPTQVAVAVAWARAHGARRVTLVGASMGGTAVTVTAQRVHADAVVDLSGPVEFLGMDTAKALPRLRMPTLVVAAANDPDTDAGRLRELVAAAPARHKRFLPVASGHGWETLAAGPFPGDGFSAVAGVVRDWVLGRYGTA